MIKPVKVSDFMELADFQGEADNNKQNKTISGSSKCYIEIKTGNEITEGDWESEERHLRQDYLVLPL